MKKKLVLVIALIVVALGIVGYFAYDAFVEDQMYRELSHKYSEAWILLGGEWRKINVVSWKDFYDDVIQVKSTDGLIYLTEYTNIVLIRTE